MSFYSDLAETAASLLKEFGQSVTVTKYGAGVEDINTGVVSSQFATTTETGVLLDYEYRTFGEMADFGGATLGAKKRLLLTAGTLINAEDAVTVDGETYRVVTVKLLNPAGTKVIYDLWIQR